MNYVVWDCETDSAQTDWATMLEVGAILLDSNCLLYTSPSPRDATLSRMPSSA